MGGINGGSNTANFIDYFYTAFEGYIEKKDFLDFEKKANKILLISRLEYYCDIALKVSHNNVNIIFKKVSTAGKWAEKLKLSFEEFDNIFKEFKIPGDLENWRERLDEKIKQIINDLEPPTTNDEKFSSANSDEYKQNLGKLNDSYKKVMKKFSAKTEIVLGKIDNYLKVREG